MFVTAADYHEYNEQQGARIYALMLLENGLTVDQVLASVIAMGEA